MRASLYNRHVRNTSEKIRDIIKTTMDEIKDVQKTDSISRFIDGHAVRTNPFGDNKAGDRAYRRAERIVAAIHLLTNHIDSSEPVCSSIRSGAVGILQHMLELRNEMRSSQSSVFTRVQASIRHLISLTRVLTVSGYISIQNATTMVEALDELGNFLTASQRSILSESVALSREDLLDVRAPILRGQSRQIKDVKDRVEVTDIKTVSVNQLTSVSESNTQRLVTVRTQNILDALQSGGLMGIKDICAHLPEYSEKMIQRELAELVEGGKVRKSGLKRWSRYSVA